MPTIAYDGKTLAVDSQSTLKSGTIEQNNCKKLWVYDDNNPCPTVNNEKVRAIALAGAISHFNAYLRFLTTGDNSLKDLGEDDSVLAIAVTDKAVYDLEYNNNKNLYVKYNLDEHVSGGTGHLIAKIAMHLGKSAVEAVKIASEFDIYTNDKVQFHCASQIHSDGSGMAASTPNEEAEIDLPLSNLFRW